MYACVLVIQFPLASVAQVWLLSTANFLLWLRLPRRFPGIECVKILVTMTRRIVVGRTSIANTRAALGVGGVPIGMTCGTGMPRKKRLPLVSLVVGGNWLKIPRKPYSAA